MSFFTMQLVVRLITSALGSCSFALIFKTHKRHLLLLSISGLITYFVYYTVGFFGGGFFLASFASTVFAAAFGELCARLCHAPAIIYLLTGLIPIVPGGEAYYTMRYFLERNMSMAMDKFFATVGVALGIAGGIVLVSLIFGVMTDRLAQKRNAGAEGANGKR
ncbi:MAG: threonine/serine exporter family protein [Clostridia bacterium]|nr:threonine/serine exporter family protein [Clostridia bacterium]